MLCEAYKHLHSIPETANEEFQTAAYIRLILRENGIGYMTLGTHTVALLHGTGTQCIVYRCDIDALLVDKEIRHACGHDGHMSIALEILLRLAKQQMTHTYLFVFQGAEEIVSGAKVLLPLLTRYNVQAIIGMHILPFVKRSDWYTKEGIFFVGSQEINCIYEGKGGHAAKPEESDDLLLEMALSIVEIQARFARKFRRHVISFGNVAVYGVRNVLPPRVVLEGTLRVFDEAERAAMLTCLQQTLLPMGRLELRHSARAVNNDGLLLAHFPRLYAKAEVQGYADDFGEYSALYPSLYLGFGGANGHLHSKDFAVDLEALAQAADDMYDFLRVLDQKIG